MRWRSVIHPARLNKRQRAYVWGIVAEYLTALLYLCEGYRILKLRHRTSHGEIDLIAAKGRTLVCVEVKARPQEGESLEAVGMRQRFRIERAAQAFMQSSKERWESIRFDVVACAPWRLPRRHPDAWRPI